MKVSLDRIVVNKAINNGQPIIRDKEISVAAVISLMHSGISTRGIMEIFPELEAEDFRQIIEYATSLSGNYRMPN